MNNLVEIDTRRVDEILATLSDKNTINEILNEGLEAMSDVYYDSILASLRREMGSAADTPGINGKYNYTLASGVKKHPDKAHIKFGVHGLTDFRLRFFEGGTKPRYSKGAIVKSYFRGNKKVNKRSGKGAYRGFITANHFFTKGVDNAQAEAERVLAQTVINALKRKGIDVQ